MNNDRIANTPGGEQMLVGAIALGLSLLVFVAYRYQLGDFVRLFVFGVMAFGAVQLVRGLWLYKYADRRAFAAELNNENLFVDLPLENSGLVMLHKIEDALIELIQDSKTLKINLHSVDTANNVGTIHLSGKQADAIFAQIYATLARFAVPNGIHLYPKPGQPVDPEIRGKRALLAAIRPGVMPS